MSKSKSNKASKASKASQTMAETIKTALQVAPDPLAGIQSFGDFALRHCHAEGEHEQLSGKFRAYFMAHYAPTLPMVQMSKAKMTEAGTVITDKAGKAVLDTWAEYNLASDELAAYRVEYFAKATLDVIESGAYDKGSITAAYACNLSDSDLGKLPDGEQKDTVKAIRASVRNVVDKRWSRVRGWLKDANRDAKADATGQTRDPATPFPSWIVQESKGGGLAEILRRRGKAEKDGLPVQSAELCKVAARIMRAGFASLSEAQKALVLAS